MTVIRKNLKRLRHLYDKTQQEIADEIGITRVAYTLYENGKRTPPPDILIAMAKVYKTTVDNIVGNTPADSAASHTSPERRADFDNYLNQVKIIYQGAAMKLTDEDRELLRQSFGATYKAILQAKKLRKQKEGAAHGREEDD